MHKLTSEIRQVQYSIDLARQIHECLCPAAMLLGLMQVSGNLEDHRDLGGQSTGTSHILRQDAGPLQAIQHAEGSPDLITCAQQRHDENLPNMELSNQIKIGVHQCAGVVGAKDFPGSQSMSGNALGEDFVDPLGLALFDSITHVKLFLVEQGDKAAAKPKKISRTHYEGLEELLQIAAGAQRGRDFQQL